MRFEYHLIVYFCRYTMLLAGNAILFESLLSVLNLLHYIGFRKELKFATLVAQKLICDGSVVQQSTHF